MDSRTGSISKKGKASCSEIFRPLSSLRDRRTFRQRDSTSPRVSPAVGKEFGSIGLKSGRSRTSEDLGEAVAAGSEPDVATDSVRLSVGWFGLVVVGR